MKELKILSIKDSENLEVFVDKLSEICYNNVGGDYMKKLFILLLSLALTSCYSTKTLEEKDHENTKDSTTTVDEYDFKQVGEKAFEINDSSNYDKSNFEKVEVLRVIDGDTIEVNIDGEKDVVRLIGVDTPESVHPEKEIEPFGIESSEFTKENLEGVNVYLEKDSSDRDKYNRLLRYVWTEIPEDFNDEEINEKLFNAKLLKEGYAKTLSIKPNTKYKEKFEKIEEDSKQNQKGIWGKTVD